jgi:hypothetical protein
MFCLPEHAVRRGDEDVPPELFLNVDSGQLARPNAVPKVHPQDLREVFLIASGPRVSVMPVVEDASDDLGESPNEELECIPVAGFNSS